MYRRESTHTRRLLSLLLMLGCLISSLAISHRSANARIETSNNTLRREQPAADKINLSQRALSFEANQGQTDGRVKFLSRGPGYTLFLTPTEAVLSLRQNQDQTPAIVRMKMIGANKNPEIAGDDKMRGKVNYFNGRARANWSSQVATYARVNYREVYPGVDLVYYGKQQQLEYDFIVAPNQDLRKIRLSFSGVRGLSLDKTGALVLETDAGEIRQEPPVAYQEIDGLRQPVAAAYVLKKQREVGFKVGDYDPSATNSILYSTYLMGNNVDEAADLAVDHDNTVYIGGRTASTNFPITLSNAYQIYNAGIFDAFVMKLHAGPSPASPYSLRYSTYLGGFSDDGASNIAVDDNESVYLTGVTQSRDLAGTPQYDGFPVNGAYQSVHGGGDDAFLSKLDTRSIASESLVYSTYLGGNGSENAAVQLGGIALDPTTPSQVYVTGTTSSANFPLRYELDNTLGGYDVFVTKIDTSQSDDASLLYSTFLGGSHRDYGTDIAVDNWGRVFVAGGTESNDFPVKCGSANAPSWDAFITVLEWGGSGILFSTYLGGDSFDQINAIAVDAGGTAHVTGRTLSSNFPVLNGFQLTPAGSGDAFVTTGTPVKCE